MPGAWQDYSLPRRLPRNTEGTLQSSRLAGGRACGCLLRSIMHRVCLPRTRCPKGGYSMPRQEILDRIQKYIQPFRITKGEAFQLKDYDHGDTCGLKLNKSEASELLQQGTKWLAEEQGMLYAQDRWSLLLVFQAMDAAGKDSTIKHVLSGVNPQGCQVSSFKQPSSEDLDHDFMWRYVRHLPER